MGRWVVALVVALAVIALSGCDWSQVAFGPMQTASNPVEPALTTSSVGQLQQIWSSESWPGPFCNCFDPLVVGGTVYVTRFDGEINPRVVDILARDAATGNERWTASLGVVENADATAVGNGLVYVHVTPVQGLDQLVALDASTGAVRWTMNPPARGTGETMQQRMVLDGSEVFITALPGEPPEISAVSPGGDVLWSIQPAGETVDGVASNGNGTLYVASSLPLTNPPNTALHLLSGYSESSGALSSRVLVQTQAVWPQTSVRLALANGLAYVNGTAIRLSDGAVMFSASGNLGAVSSTAVVLAGDSTVTVRNPTTGALLWSTPEDQYSYNHVAIAGNLLYLGASGSLEVRDVATGALAASVSLDASGIDAVVPSAGRVLVLSAFSLDSFAPVTN